jgi:hypothetical protein
VRSSTPSWAWKAACRIGRWSTRALVEAFLSEFLQQTSRTLDVGETRARRVVRLCSKAVVTGVAFFDFDHGQTGVAPNAIELHPILAFRCLSSG